MRANQNKFILDQYRNSTDFDIDLANNNTNQFDNCRKATVEPLILCIQCGIIDYCSSANYCNTPPNEILAEVQDVVRQGDLIECLSTPTSFDEVSSK